VNKSEIRPEEAKANLRREAYSRSYNHPNTRSVVAPEEDLFPGLAYVAIAGVAGSLVARQSKFAIAHCPHFVVSVIIILCFIAYVS
jgi:hypothetical protein